MKDDEARLVYIALAGLVIFLGFFFRHEIVNNLLGVNEQATNEITSVDLASLTWQKATTTIPWQPRDSHTVFEFQNKLWLMGGIDGNSNTNGTAVPYWEMPHFNDIWSSVDGIHWTKESAAAAWPPRRSASIAKTNDTLYLIGGWSPVSGYANEIWSSKDAITWSNTGVTAPWPHREGQILETFNNTFFIFGGVNYDTRAVFNDVWYSKNGISWQQATTTIPWSGRWDHAVAEFKDELYLIGGMNLNKKTFNDVWKSSDGMHWELVTENPPWQARQGFEAVVYKDVLWIVGRLDDAGNGGVNDVWFTTNGTTWQKTKINPPWLGREDHAAVIFKNKMWILGGMDKNWRWQNDVWYNELLESI